ncbi:DUF4232 domain-containing protein [Actinoplanes auranticolor]|uniref:DUF4232 domain-containing protein n=1 Tax=Actinoplanes auranticolor TaxID=47988 RepID=A0A919VLK3_9ACTN|nr:DUF4232 domain-containing protein [Actinoplanes auranticolor]GIM67818.1 hypothetical protein Aau02nite_28980 [Actinoplanes auranticolor]
MRNIGRGTLLAAGALGLTLAAAPSGATAGTFTAGNSGMLDLAAVSATAYTLVLPDAGADYVDPATGEPPSRCRTGELRITGDAGSLVFENITGHACSLRGHPGVKTAAGALTPAGAAAPAMLLAPGDHVRAAVLPATCETTVRVPGFQVAAPEDRSTTFVGAPHEACAAGSVAAFTAAG